MTDVKKLGIYGGTFDPFHAGHYAAATAFVNVMHLDKLLLIPAKLPPHKSVRDGDDAEKRLQMLMAQFGEDEKIVPCDHEMRRDGVSYSVYTLRHFAKQAQELYMLVGTDMFLSLDRWYLPEEIFSLCTVVCFGREGDGRLYGDIMKKKSEYEKNFGAKIAVPDYSPIELSSTYVREVLEKGGDASELVPDKIYRYIRDHGMYRIYSEDDIEYLKERMPEYVQGKRLEHVYSVERCADRICDIQGIGGQERLKIRIAALLHDIAKAYDKTSHTELAEELSVKLSENDINAPATLHALNGAYLAKRDFPRTVDNEIADMIHYHCTGKANMTDGEKIVFLADYIEPGRDNPACERVRNAYFDNNNEKNIHYRLDRAVFLAYDLTVSFLKRKGGFIHPDTLDGIESVRVKIEQYGKG